MPRIAYETPEFRKDFRRSSRQDQSKIEAFIEKFDVDVARAGMDLKTPNGAIDQRVKTARVDRGLRAVLIDLGSNGYALHRVMEHEAAYRFVSALRPDVSTFNGLPRIVQIPQLEQPPPPVDGPRFTSVDLFAHRRDRDFTAVGVPEFLIPSLRLLENEARVSDFVDLLAQSDPLLGIAILGLLDRTTTVDALFAELVSYEGGPAPGAVRPDGVYNGVPEAFTTPEEFDSSDLGAALERAGADERFRLIEDSAELIEALRGEFADWQVFLHPLQREAAYAPAHSGSVRVSGGAGTGKTVVLLHRAKALLDRGDADDPPRILVTTFTPHLRDDLQRLLEQLVGERAKEVDIHTVDSLARTLHHDMGAEPVRELDPAAEARLWTELASGTNRSPLFLRGEYRHVLLARGIRTLDDYLTTARSGRGTPLKESERRALWPAFEAFEAKTRQVGLFTSLQLTESVAGLLEKLPTEMYDHILVDEAQDLHASQWRLLRAIVDVGPDDLFIVGDAFQRIYGDTVSLRSLGIETRGRSRRLRRNYRTTHEVVDWALTLVGSETVMDIDEMGADLSGYHSVRHGPVPVVRAYTKRSEELAGLVDTVERWLALDYAPEAIAVTGRSGPEIKEITTALQRASIPAAPLGRRGRVKGAVNVATMHRLKGLEYPCVAVTGLSAELTPPDGAVCAMEDDPAQHRTDVQAERSLIYVAATRARDEVSVSWNGEPTPLLTEASLVASQSNQEVAAWAAKQ